ncbi:MAG: MBL fold metallo-hydrolase, partial [Thermodesulfobacteriaceae bacterium]|nr:MBL fold metallo-hydrolase [Thermodesulfobacteriaceae bacterium]
LWGFPEIPKASSFFEDGELIKIGKKILKVIHTPGHSPGSVCFWEEEEGILFTGDTLFVQGIGRADLPGGNYKLMMESIRKRLLILPKETKIYPGHDYGPKPTSTIEEELKFNPFLQEF